MGWPAYPIVGGTKFGCWSNDVIFPVDTQSIVDSEILMAARSGISWFFDYFPPLSAIAPYTSEASKQNAPLRAYIASQYHDKIKFALTLLPGYSFEPNADISNYDLASPQWAAIIADLTSLFSDPQYVRFNGMPVVFFFGVMTTSTNMSLARYNDIVAAAGGAMFAISAGHSNSTASTYSMAGETVYGPDPNLPSGSARHPFSTMFSADQVDWPGILGRYTCVSWGFQNDRRPIQVTAYIDEPTQPELIRSLRSSLSFSGNVLTCIYSWDEISEGGGMLSAQETAPETGYSRYLDAVGWETGKVPIPTSYTYYCSLSNAGGAVAHSGTGWVTAGPTPGATNDGSQIDGAYDYDEETSSTAGDSITFTGEKSWRIMITGTTSPDVGQFSVSLDGNAPVTVDPYTPSGTTRNAHLWDSGLLDSADHTVVMTVLGTKNPSSSSVQVRLDAVIHVFNPALI